MEGTEEVTLEGGAYEIIRGRLNTLGKELKDRLNSLNEARKEVFGSVETKLLGSDRINTDNNCTPRDLFPLGTRFIFGYNVQVGLRSEIKLHDVFSVYDFVDHQFKKRDLELLNNPKFHEDFENLYRYYKNTIFAKFTQIGPHLFMVFRVGKSSTDIKTFKWLIEDDSITYIDNRSDAEFKYPTQHDFVWKRTHRDYHRSGEHPHISIEDRVFVETVGGDLTIKIDDNTRDGVGIYNEPVDDPDQNLDDGEFYYTIVGHLILLKIKPYQEKQYRYFVFNEKLGTVTRIDAIESTCVFLPDDHGIIFPNGYYLATGRHKIFDTDFSDMMFDCRVASPNGEDYLYCFYQREQGHYVLLSYNLISQEVTTPIVCEGYSIFNSGELVYFRAEEEPQKHHTVQFWQTPYVSDGFEVGASSDSPLHKIGNKDIVRAMAECNEILNLIEREEIYASLYIDIVKKAGDVSEAWFWLANEEAFNLAEALAGIREAAGSAVDEFDKVQKVKRATKQQTQTVADNTHELLNHIKRSRFESIEEFVHKLSELRVISGEIISAGELRYADTQLIENLNDLVKEQRDKLSSDCVNFLLSPNALQPYEDRITDQAAAVESFEKVSEAKEIEEALAKNGSELELLIEIVSNLKIDDPTKTTEIIDAISDIYTRLNQLRAELKNRSREMAKSEGAAEYNAQMKLLSQAMINYLDVCDEPEKCDNYLTRLMVQVEELEGRFADFDEFAVQLAEKRDEIYNAFEAKKLNLVEARNKRTGALMSAADRILKGIKNRIGNFKTINEINGYFAGDLMIEKVRDIVSQLKDLDDSVKADSLQSQLKTIREDAVRQLKDRQDLFEGGDNVIRLGEHRFSVNTQDLALTIVAREDGQYYHLTGTNFFEKIADPQFLETQDLWDREYLSESREVYRGEYLAYQYLLHLQRDGQIGAASAQTREVMQKEIQKFMGPRFQEGYAKGVHDQDAALMLEALLKLHSQIGLLIYPSEARACAAVFWLTWCPQNRKTVLERTCRGVGAIEKLFPDPERSKSYVNELEQLIGRFLKETGLFSEIWIKDAAVYLFRELTSGEGFCISQNASDVYDGFDKYLRENKSRKRFDETTDALQDDPINRFFLVRDWIGAYVKNQSPENEDYIDEAAALYYCDHFDRARVIHTHVSQTIEGLRGDHNLIKKGVYQLHYNHFIQKLEAYEAEQVPRFIEYLALKKQLAEGFRKDLKLDEFKPRILSSFVRNQLIDKVYLSLIGDNLAKQVGVVGEKKRTDLMGMLLLISPPGYGKTTLMEYVADRLGVIFMKINGPAIGHQVTSLDPAEAPNASARDELKKLNLAFEMGDNIMIYLDDIQHCNPELLQKFISLCDGQRKIEGVYKGVSRTYDLRGKKVAVVMAGNPYTESGEKFQIPDMLANRADTYNLGDIIGDTEDVFRMSYIENCLTSNATLNKLMSRSQKDVYSLIKIAEKGSREGVELEGNYSGEEINDFVNVLSKLLRVRDVILAVNLQYIESAAQADAYRTEPPFKLQGSYRNMNKIAEKVLPIMNDEELESLIHSHYENESQTLTSGAEANLLKFKELTGKMTEEEMKRWEDIKSTFARNLSLTAAGDDRMGQAILQLAGLGQGLEGIQGALANAVERLSGKGGDEVMLSSIKDILEQSRTENDNRDTLDAIKVMTDRVVQALETPKSGGLDEATLLALRKIAAQMVKAMSVKKASVSDSDLDATSMKEIFNKFLENAPARSGGIDEETLTALKATLKMSKATGREERQAMLILLEKQFHVMEQWLKPLQEGMAQQDTKLLGLQTAMERSLSTQQWVISRLKEMTAPEVETTKPETKPKPPPKPQVRRQNKPSS